MSDIDEELDRGNVQVTDGTTRCAWNDAMDKKYEPSGVVVLYICKLGPEDKCTGIKWGSKQQHYLTSIKANTIDKTNAHHESVGDYFSFGNKSFYVKIGNSSVSQYAIKKGNYMKQE